MRYNTLYLGWFNPRRYAYQGNLAEAVSAASLFAGRSNELASRFGIGNSMQQVLEWGDTILAADMPPDDQTAAKLWPLAHTLINTCTWRAKRHPTHARRYYEHGVEFATYAGRWWSLRDDFEYVQHQYP